MFSAPETSWSAWSQCSKTCEKTRSREKMMWKRRRRSPFEKETETTSCDDGLCGKYEICDLILTA